MPTTQVSGQVAYLQGLAVGAAQNALLGNSVLPPGQPPTVPPWAEVEHRITACPGGDPDALAFDCGHPWIDRGVAERMAGVTHSRHVLTARDHTRGVSCYTTWLPRNTGELLDNPGAPPDMGEALYFSLTTTPQGATGGILMVCETGDGRPPHTIRAPDVATACRGALHWVYRGYPLTPYHTATTTPQKQPQPQRLGVHRSPWPLYYLGWVIRWVVSYTAVAMFVGAALAAGCHGWLEGLYVDEVLTVIRGTIGGAVLGTALKYTGVLLMGGLPGVLEELRK